MDIALRRGVLVRGRITDRVTKRGVRAWASYLPYGDNPHAGETPQVFGINDDYDVEPDGSFHLVALPGPGVVAAYAWEQRYRTSRPEQWGHPANPHGTIRSRIGDRCAPRISTRSSRSTRNRARPSCVAELVLEPGISIRGLARFRVDLDDRRSKSRARTDPLAIR